MIAVLVGELFAALCGVTVFHCSTSLGLLVMALSLGTVVCRLFILKKLPKWMGQGICMVVAVLGILFLFRMKPEEVDYHLKDYMTEVLDLEQMIVKEDRDALSELEKFEERYGEDDTTFGLRAMERMKAGDPEGADSYIRQCSIKNEEYYMLKESYYLMDGSRDTSGDLYYMYLEAAEQLPEWEYAQRMAGITQYEKQNYTSAEYYLAAAYEINPGIPITQYYLGVLAYRIGDFNKCMMYFGEAMQNNADEKLQSWMAWYVQKMEEEK